MKKIKLLLLILPLTLINCTQPEDNCGIVTKDYLDGSLVTIKNNKTNNEKDFRLSYDNWLNAFIGEEYCVEFQKEW